MKHTNFLVRTFQELMVVLDKIYKSNEISIWKRKYNDQATKIASKIH